MQARWLHPPGVFLNVARARSVERNRARDETSARKALGARACRWRWQASRGAHAEDRRRADPEAVLPNHGRPFPARSDARADLPARAERADAGYRESQPPRARRATAARRPAPQRHRAAGEPRHGPGDRFRAPRSRRAAPACTGGRLSERSLCRRWLCLLRARGTRDPPRRSLSDQARAARHPADSSRARIRLHRARPAARRAGSRIAPAVSGCSLPREAVDRAAEAAATKGRLVELVRHGLPSEPPARAPSATAKRGRRAAPRRHPLGCRIRGCSTLELLGGLPNPNRAPPTGGACRRRLLERLGNSRGSRADSRGTPTPGRRRAPCRELSTDADCRIAVLSIGGGRADESACTVRVVPTDEDLMIARHTRTVLGP